MHSGCFIGTLNFLILLDFLVERTGNYLVLLLLCELNEVYRVTAYSYCKLGISLGMSLSIKESFTGENVNVEMMSALLNVTVKECNEVIYLVLCCCHFLLFLSFRMVYYNINAVAYQ